MCMASLELFEVTRGAVAKSFGAPRRRPGVTQRPVAMPDVGVESRNEALPWWSFHRKSKKIWPCQCASTSNTCQHLEVSV